METVKQRIPYENRKLQENLAVSYFKKRKYDEALKVLKELGSSEFTSDLTEKINDSLHQQGKNGRPAVVSDNNQAIRFYEKIGVQTGDVLQRVNGVDIRDPSTMLSLLQQLKNEQIVKLDVVRNNQRSTITYELR